MSPLFRSHQNDRGLPTAVVLEFFLLLVVVLGPLAFGCVEPWSRALLEFALFGMLFFRFRSPRRLDLHPIHMTLLIGGACLVLIGLLQGFNPSSITGPRGFMPFTASLYETRRALLLWGSYLALLICIPTILERPGAPNRLAWTFVSVGFVVAAVGIWNYADIHAFIYGFRPVPYGRSAFGPYFNGGHASSMMALSLLVGLGLFISRIAGFDRHLAMGGRTGDFLLLQGILLLFLLTIAAGIIRQSNRGTLIATAGSIWVMGVLASGLIKGAKSWGLRLLLFGGLASAALTVYFSPTLFGLFKGLGENSVAFRIAMYRDGITLWQDFPFWGIGLGSVITVFYAYKDPMVLGILDHVHNDWLEILLEAGLVGFILFGGSILLLFGRVWSRWTEAPPEERWLRAGAMAAALGFLFHALIEFSFQIPANAVLWLILMAWLGTRHRESEGKPLRHLPMGKPLRAALAGTALTLGTVCLGPGIGNIHRQRAKTPIKSEKVSRLERAYWWDSEPLLAGQLTRFHIRSAKAANGPKVRTELRKALEWVNKGLEMDPLNSYLLQQKGVTLWRLDRKDDAHGFRRRKWHR